MAPVYHFRLDVRETVGNRPGGVVLSAFLCFLVGSGVFVALLSMALMMVFMMGSLEGFLIFLLQALIAVTVFTGTSLLGCGLLAGWNWTRWVVIVLAGGVVLVCLGGGVVMVITAASMVMDPTAMVNGDEAIDDPEKAAPEKEPPFKAQNFVLGMFAMYAVPLLLVLICGVTTFVSLLMPSTGAWFHMAGKARREHRALLKSQGD